MKSDLQHQLQPFMHFFWGHTFLFLLKQTEMTSFVQFECWVIAFWQMMALPSSSINVMTLLCVWSLISYHQICFAIQRPVMFPNRSSIIGVVIDGCHFKNADIFLMEATWLTLQMSYIYKHICSSLLFWCFLSEKKIFLRNNLCKWIDCRMYK